MDDAADVSRKQSDVHHWSFNGSTAKNGEVGASAALDAIRRGSYNLTHTYTNCSPWGNTKYAATAHWDGSTVDTADITGTDCGNPDSFNIVDFGYVDGNGSSSYNTLALTCSWFNPLTREVGTADISFGQAEDWAGLTEDCYREWRVDTLATHEWGHVFGMNHVSESSHGNLTMSPIMEGMCKRPESTLGFGDWQGIRYQYPN